MVKRSFGVTKDGKEVFLFSLENKNKVKAEVTNYGAILVNLFVPDKNGNIEQSMLEPLMPWSKTLPADCYSKRRK